MHLDSRFTGTSLRPYKTKTDWRHMMNYAAAIGDMNDAYFDDERPGGVTAHPLFCAALTWPITEKIWEFIEAEDFPRELIMTQVHFTEHLEFHRPIKNGDELVINGVIAAIQPHRAGTHVIIRFSAKDTAGSPLFTEHIGGLMRGVQCMGGAAGTELIPVVPQAPSGVDGWESVLHIGPDAPFIYDGCTSIFFPIHTSRRFARQVGLPGILYQGTATLALAVREIVNREAGGDPDRVKKISCKFTGMVLPGTDITVRQTGALTAGDGHDIFFAVLNSEGRRAISDGYAHITR